MTGPVGRVAAILIVSLVSFAAVANDCPMGIASVSPASGPVSGGTLVTITADPASPGFTACLQFEPPFPVVAFGGAPAEVVEFPSGWQVIVRTPYHVPGTVDVTVSQLGRTGTTLQAFTYVDAPAIPTMTKQALVILVFALAAIAFVRLR